MINDLEGTESTFSRALQLIKTKKYKSYLYSLLACIAVGILLFLISLVGKNVSYFFLFLILPFFVISAKCAIENAASNYLSIDIVAPANKYLKCYTAGILHVTMTILKSALYSFLVSAVVLGIAYLIISGVSPELFTLEDLVLYFRDPSVSLPNIDTIEEVLAYSSLIEMSLFCLFVIFLNRKYELAIHVAAYSCNSSKNHFLLTTIPLLDFKKCYQGFWKEYRKKTFLTDFLTFVIFAMGVVVGVFVGRALMPSFKLLSLALCGIAFGFIFYGFLHGFIRAYDAAFIKANADKYVATFPAEFQTRVAFIREQMRLTFEDDVFHPQYLLPNIRPLRTPEENRAIYNAYVIFSNKELDLIRDLTFDQKTLIEEIVAINNGKVPTHHSSNKPAVFGLDDNLFTSKPITPLEPPPSDQAESQKDNEEKHDEE